MMRELLKTLPGAVPLVRYVRRLTRPAPQHAYWKTRKDLLYYGEVLRLARKHCPGARSVVDIGSMASPFILKFDWIPDKTSLDLRVTGRLRGCRCLKADFMSHRFTRSFDLVLCLQVLEHLEAPAPFARKLLATGRTVIISVPYKWPRGLDPNHVQDPVDEAKLLEWTGRPWLEHVVARELNGVERLIVVVPGGVLP